jgi:hypothetical protein
MKYQISNYTSNPRWVDNYVLHHYVTLVHDKLKATGQLEKFHECGPEKKKLWVDAAKSVGLSNVSLEDDNVWIDIPDTADTMFWMLKT